MGKLIEKIKKRVYEWSKPEFPEVPSLRIERVDVQLKHYVAAQRVSKYEYADLPQGLLGKHIAAQLESQLADAIARNVETEEDYCRNEVVYRVDIWMKS